MSIASAHHQNVFDVYVGLTAAGYDLANPSRAGAITDVINSADWDQATLDYFRRARIDDGRVNPYWPRASILTAVSYLAVPGNHVLDIASVQTYLGTLPNVSPAERDASTVGWAVDLPTYTRSLRTASCHDTVTDCHREAVSRERAENGPVFRERIGSARSMLGALLPLSPYRVLTVLNPLQADSLADVIELDGSAYIITSHLSTVAYVHELIHLSVTGLLQAWSTEVSDYRHLLDAVYEPMSHLSYAWDRTAVSWHNVFSETLVRALTIYVLEDPYSGEYEERVQVAEEEGFLYLRSIIDSLIGTAGTDRLSEEWLDRCLRACCKAVGA